MGMKSSFMYTLNVNTKDHQHYESFDSGGSNSKVREILETFRNYVYQHNLLKGIDNKPVITLGVPELISTMA